MKKIYSLIICFFLCISLYSCKEKDNVEIFVNSDLKVDINSVDDYMWKAVITIRVNGEDMPYGDSFVTLCDGEELIVGEDALFMVTYNYNGKKYTKEFTVKIYEKVNTCVVQLEFLNGETKSYNFKEKEYFNLNTVSTFIDGYNFKGWYRDSLYNVPYTNEVVDSNVKLYGKWENIIYFKSSSVDSVMMNSYIDDLLSETDSYIPSWNKEGFKGRWNYIDGVFLNSVVNLYENSYDEKYKDFFLNYINYYIDGYGDFINPVDYSLGYRSGELDSVCASKILFDAYNYTNDVRYLNAIRYTYNELKKMSITTNGINYSHKETYLNQVWLDGMYMYVPFLARYALLVNEFSIFDDIVSQYKYIRDNMFDEDKKLYYHGHDTSKSVFWADKDTGNSKSFWLRSMGWYIVSIVDVLEYFPNGADKDYLISLLNEAIDGLLQYKDDVTNMFYQIVDKKSVSYLVPKKYLEGLKNTNYLVDGTYVDRSISNYLESSGSSMIAYVLLKSSRLGYIDSSYYEIGKSIYEGVYSYSFKDGVLNDICITAGLGPESNQIRDGSIYYYLAEKVGSNDAKGVGPFIMAYIEYIGGTL